MWFSIIDNLWFSQSLPHYPFPLKAPVKWSFDPGEIKVDFTPVKQKKTLVSQGKLDKN